MKIHQSNSVTENISHLQAALGSIADSMISNLLCLNSAKTEISLAGSQASVK